MLFQVASFGYLSVQIWIEPFSNPDTPSQSRCRFAPRWLHLDAFLFRSGSSHFGSRRRFPKTIADLFPDGFIRIPFCSDLNQAISNPGTPSQSRRGFASIELHLDAFLFRSGSSHFGSRRRFPKTTADLVPDGFIRTPFRPDPDQAIFKPRYQLPVLNSTS